MASDGRLVVAGSAGHSFALARYQNEIDLETLPQITGAEVSGKKLYVYGKDFDAGAQLLLNGERQKKTSNDVLNLTTMLIAKKSGKKIGRGETVMLRVQNRDGRSSDVFTFARPRLATSCRI
jgi:hypothetical protein